MPVETWGPDEVIFSEMLEGQTSAPEQCNGAHAQII